MESKGVPDHIIVKIQDGTLGHGAEYDRWIRGADMINAANMLEKIGQIEKQIKDLNDDITMAGKDQEEAKKFEASARERMTGADVRKTKIYDAWKKSDPTIDDDVAWANAEHGFMPEQKKPNAGGSQKPTTKPGTRTILSGKK